ncbi:hypothetical protein Tco_0521625, partial [Tanacetum coccineum]
MSKTTERQEPKSFLSEALGAIAVKKMMRRSKMKIHQM